MARGFDRISDLSEGVLHHILSLLSAQDAVRTFVLARSWRNRWWSAPALHIACSTGMDGVDDAFGRFVDGLLRVRRGGLPLDSCDFDLVADLKSSHYDLDLHGNRWIRRVLELKVREMQFRVFGKLPYLFKLESTLLSSQHLTSLELTGVKDNDAVLDFYECPALESLKMEQSCVRSSTEMQSPSLKHLSIKSCFFDNMRPLMLFPSLISFEFINNFATAPMLETMPCLEAAKVHIHHGYDVCKNGRLDHCGDDACRGCFLYEEDGVFLNGLAEATYLDLSAPSDMIVFYRDLKWCPAFNKLKTLVLKKWFVSTDLSALIWFLHHTPLLEKLTLETPKEHKSLMETEGSYIAFEKSIASSHLQIVEIMCKNVDGIVLKVLKALNANGIPLGKIRIQCSGCKLSMYCHDSFVQLSIRVTKPSVISNQTMFVLIYNNLYYHIYLYS